MKFYSNANFKRWVFICLLNESTEPTDHRLLKSGAQITEPLMSLARDRYLIANTACLSKFAE